MEYEPGLTLDAPGGACFAHINVLQYHHLGTAASFLILQCLLTISYTDPQQ